MNKRNKIFALSSSCLMLLGLVSCGDVAASQKDHVLVEFSNNEVVVTADDVFERYLTTKDGVEAAYNQINDAVARHIMYDEKLSYKDKAAELVAEAKADVDDVKAEAKNNASTNKTKYEEELDKLLKNNNAKNLDELRIIFENKKFRTYLEDNFYDEFLDQLKTGEKIEAKKDGKVLGEVAVDSYINDVLPYHVKHILVKVGASASNYTTSTISESDAEDLATTIKTLGTNTTTTFGQKAKDLSDDAGSAAEYGDLGLMSINTSFVNEFKLGIYAYDTLFNNATKDASQEKKDNLLLKEAETYTNYLKEHGLNFIPSGIADLLLENKDATLDAENEQVNDGKEQYFPRNIYWNEYLNKHEVSLIEYSTLEEKDDTITVEEAKTLSRADNARFMNQHVPAESELELENGFIKGTNYYGFDFIEKYEGTTPVVKKHFVLTDGDRLNPKPILVTRAGTGEGEEGYQGIHFIVVQRSALVETENGISLDDYYTTELPGQDGNFPAGHELAGKRVYVNAFDDTQKAYQSRVDKLKDEIKGADNSIDKKINNYYFLLSGAEIKNPDLKKKLDIYIDADQVADDTKSESELVAKWKEYIEMLTRQNSERASKKLIPLVCAVKFDEASNGNPEIDALYGVGGVCHYVEQKA